MKQGSLRKKHILLILCAALVLTGCGSLGLAREESFESNYELGEEESENIFVSAAKTIVKSVDRESQTIDFYVAGSSELKTLSYDGATLISDQYGQPLIVDQLNCGDIAKIAYNSAIGKVGTIELDAESFKFDDLSKYSISDNGQSFGIGDDLYSIDPNVHIFSDGMEISLDRLIPNDGLSVQGTDRNILSIRVDHGHGYLDLDNEYALIGGWIEIGQAVISEISSGMLFTVPEGTYNVRLTNKGIEEYREVTIQRNEITTLDLSDIEIYTPDRGQVSFRITPEGASAYIDGTYVDTSYDIMIPVGMHEIYVTAPGYADVTEYFDVTGERQTVTIDLENETATVSENSISSTLSSEGKSGQPIYATITIDSPVDVDVYEDNLYKGILPVTYQKNPGTHVITLRKDGYVTTSYTIIVYDDGQDVTYSLPELVKDENSNSDPTVSGNSVDTEKNKDQNGQTVSGNRIDAGAKEFFPKASTDLLWDEDLNVLSEEGLKMALEQIDRYEETAIKRENIIRIKKALEKYGYTEDYWN